MFNKAIVLSTAALAALAFAAPAMAIDSVNTPLAHADTAAVAINITVSPTVSVWTSDTPINLNLNGSGPNNATAATGNLSMVSNVASDIKVNVVGNLPADAGNGNYIQFILFPNRSDPGTVISDLNSNSPAILTTPSAYGPFVGGLRWSYGDVGAPGLTQTLLANEPAHLGGNTFPIVYAADDPGGVPNLTTTPWGLTVTYTIAPHSS